MTALHYSIWKCPRCVSFDWDMVSKVKRCKRESRGRIDKGVILDDAWTMHDNECKYWVRREK